MKKVLILRTLAIAAICGLGFGFFPAWVMALWLFIATDIGYILPLPY